MSYKNVFSAIALVLSYTCVCAQKNIQEPANNNATAKFFQADSTVQPTSASVIVYSTIGYSENADKLITTLNKKGIAAFKVIKTAPGEADMQELFQKLRINAIKHKVTDPKIGILTFGKISLPASMIKPADFVGMVDPGTLSKLKIPAAVPLFIDQSGDTKGDIRFYSSRIQEGKKTDMHLHQQPVSNSARYTELINWMTELGLLKAISDEKTEAQRKQQDWENFMKIIDDRLHNDWAWLKRYEDNNDKMPAPAKDEKRVIFLGNSITEGWINKDPEFFESHKYINRGIGGQTTPQMLVRFREDVVNLHPGVVIILAGINDIAENTGPSRLENVAGNIISMAEIAKANGIKVILCSVLPAIAFPWHREIDPVQPVIKLNAMLKNYAVKNKLTYVDYYSAVVDAQHGFKKELTIDGVHPNLAGYKIMEPLAESAINKVLIEN
ncbi:MAG: SGNH/GDSL hydrolase family protein [Mucilaginibacter sp.]